MVLDIDLFDTNDEIGDYTDKETGKVKKGKGIKAIAMPSELETVPDWLLAIIDVDALTEDNMKLFSQLYKPLGLSASKRGTQNAYYSNIVRI